MLVDLDIPELSQSLGQKAILPIEKHRSQKDADQLRAFLSNLTDQTINVSFRPSSKNRDHVLDMVDFSISSKDDLLKSPHINGQVQLISFTIPNAPGKVGDRAEWVDKFGNIISSETVIGNGGKPERYISIIPPFALSDNNVQGAQSVSIDLSRLKFGEANNIFSVSSLPIAGKIGGNDGYLVYLDTDNIKVEDIAKGRASAYANGGATAERVFGLPQGDALRRIVLYEDVQGESFFQKNNPDTIFVAESSLSSEKKQLLAFNLTTELIDHKYNISGGAFHNKVEEILKGKEGERLWKLLLEEESPLSSDWKEFLGSLNASDRRDISRSVFSSLVSELQQDFKGKNLSKEDRNLLKELATTLEERLGQIKDIDPKILIQKIRQFRG